MWLSVATLVPPDEERPAGSRRRALLRVHYIKPGGAEDSRGKVVQIIYRRLNAALTRALFVTKVLFQLDGG
jgi:hypothetical protein